MLVVLVILFFLRSFRAAIIPIVTIPVSLIATFTLMFALGFSVNTLTLLAMVLAIGLVVDDAIVVLENIYRHIEDGMEPVAAAIKGMREIGFAVIAMTLTLAAVYAPIAFAPGKTGRLFLEFALTLAGAVLVSGFVALTLTPMMSSKLLRHDAKPGRSSRLLERRLRRRARSGYRRLLERGAARSRPLCSFSAARRRRHRAASSSRVLKSELAPLEDRGVIRVRGTGPEGATVTYTARYAAEVDAIMADGAGGARPPVDQRHAGSVAVAGRRAAQAIGTSARARSSEITRESRRSCSASPAFKRSRSRRARSVSAARAGRSNSSSSRRAPMKTCKASPIRCIERRATYPGLRSLDTDLKLNTPEFRIEIDRAKVADLGLDVTAVGRTLETLLGGRQVTRFEQNGEQYDVFVQLAADDRATPQALSTIFLRNARGEMIQLSNVVQRQRGGGAQGTEALQPAALGDHPGEPCAGLYRRRGITSSRQAAREVLPRDRRKPISAATAAIVAHRPTAWRWCSCWRWPLSIWCWPRSSRASAIR